MADNVPANNHNIPAWLVRTCRWLTTKLGWLWPTLTGLVLGVVTNYLYAAKDTGYTNFSWTTFWQNWYITVITLIILGILSVLVWITGELPIIESPAQLKRQYLTRRKLQTQDLAIEGIPLLPPQVKLDEIYIPLRLFPDPSNIDQWLTPELRQKLRAGIRCGRIAPEVESVLVDAEKSYELFVKGHREKTIELQELWQRLTKDYPAAVIRGYPGMGKSTLLLRLTLLMARGGLKESDQLEGQISPLLIPLFIRLGRYATFWREAGKDKQPKRSLWDYLSSPPKELEELGTPAMFGWLVHCLQQGQCLVLFDGLDEISDPTERYEVQEAIKAFIEEVRSKTSSTTSYNRFLITSRVAGYDHDSFPGCPLYTIAELTPEQIRAFLPRWCRASVRHNGSHGQESSPEAIEAHVASQAAMIEQKLNNAIQSHYGINELVENPFLLTLLAIMQQNNIELPRRRVELYTTITLVLLERRNAVRGLPVIPEAQAVQRLGPVAYQMQATKNSFVTKKEVLSAIASTIEHLDHATKEQAQDEAAEFLARVRERGGIFVLRTGDYYGFFHRTFQEYFTARQILRDITANPQTGIADLLQKARQLEDLWREPFLLAVAYQTSNEGTDVWELIKQLLTFPASVANKQHYHDVLLAGWCLLEAKDSTVPRHLEREIVYSLLDIYADAQHTEDFDVCVQVESIVQRLLLNLSNETTLSPLLMVLQETILASQNQWRQRATLTLLTVIAQDLRDCKPIVFAKLVPPLLGLTGLPAPGEKGQDKECFQPLPPAVAPDLDTVDLAFSALSFLGEPGPSGLSLRLLRPQFEPYLPLLADYSLQIGILITPTVIPLAENNFQGYAAAIERWQQLQDDLQKGRGVTKQDKTTSLNIQRDLLQYAEESCYPAEIHLLRMLERSPNQPDQPWQAIWQNYLRTQMNAGTTNNTSVDLSYQICALLWTTLFSDPQDQGALADVMQEHWADSAKHQRQAQRFLLSLVRNLRDWRDLRYLREWRDLRYLLYWREWQQWRGLRDWRQWREWLEWRELRGGLDLRGELNLLYWRNSFNILFSYNIGLDAGKRLKHCIVSEQTELLTLLFGRILQIQEEDENGTKTEQEVQRIVLAALPFAQASNEAREAVLDIICYLPMRTVQEVTYVLDFAEKAQDKDLQAAAVLAIRYARPATSGAWTTLEQGRTSSVSEVREAVEKTLKRKPK